MRKLARNAHSISGGVLMAYVATHYLNHAVGAVSLDAAGAVGIVFGAFWGFPIAKAALYGGLVVHLMLAIWMIARRPSFADFRPGEAAQWLSGVAVAFLLVNHVSSVMFLEDGLDIQTVYVGVVAYYWVFRPDMGILQALAMLAAWIHGCLGLRAVARFKPWCSRLGAAPLVAAIVVPMAAFYGFATMGREVEALVADEEAWSAILATLGGDQPEQAAALAEVQGWVYGGLAALFMTALAARLAAFFARRSRRHYRVDYEDGGVFRASIGSSILDVSRDHGVPHASVCGGRGRCSTCRVRVLSGLETLDAPGELEARVLERVGAPPNVRLACQTKPKSDVRVALSLAPTATVADGRPTAASRNGDEQEIAVLFADMRGFTALSEDLLPYDLVYILNRYFRAMGTAIEEAGGHVDKFVGDGVMALFGIDEDPALGCRRALDAARRMSTRLDELNHSLQHEIKAPMRIGVGVNVGPVIVGEMGFGAAKGLTAIGDVVNTASRLEALTKEHRVELIFASAVAERAGLSFAGLKTDDVDVRGRAERVRVTFAPSASLLGAALDA